VLVLFKSSDTKTWKSCL